MKRYVFLLKVADYDFMDKIVSLPIIHRHDDSYFLYAYTDDKSIAKRFQEERNMQYFKKEKIEIDPNDDPFDKRIYMELDNFQLNSSDYVHDVIMTEFEHDYITYESITDIIHDHIIDDCMYIYERVDLLLDRFKDILLSLDVFNICDPLPFKPDYVDEEFVECDYLEIFIKTFKEILK